MKYILIGIIAGLLSFIINVKAQDVTSKTFTKEVMCSEHAFVTNDLEKHHKQFRKWWAVSNQNELIELFVNNEQGSWTIILSNSDGITCGLVGGHTNGLNFNVDNNSSEEGA